MRHYLTEQDATEEAQEWANFTGRTQYVYWAIYGCYWFYTESRYGTGANVNYERIIESRL